MDKKRLKRNKLSVFSKEYYLKWTSFPGFKYNIGLFFRNFKYAYQRITKGYCERDLWNMDYWICNILSNAFHDFARDTHSYPDEVGYNGWLKKINNASDELWHSCAGNEPFGDETDENYKEEIEARRKSLAEALHFLYEYLDDLWD